MDFFDKGGKVTCYTSDGERLYLWTGKPGGYFSDDRVYGFNGKLLGWFSNGWLYDRKNNPALFSPESSGRPTRPVRSVSPVKLVRSVRPIKSFRQIAHVRPVKSLSWSKYSSALYFQQ